VPGSPEPNVAGHDETAPTDEYPPPSVAMRVARIVFAPFLLVRRFVRWFWQC
jgi:hypothetical protein